MAKEAWTVMFNIRDVGGMEPFIVKEKKLKVMTAAGATKEKNGTYQLNAPAANIKTAEVQECYFVTLEAESAEEAVLAVQKYYGAGGKTAAEAGQLEEAGGGGPTSRQFTNAGKWLAFNYKGAGENTTTEVAVV